MHFLAHAHARSRRGLYGVSGQSPDGDAPQRSEVSAHAPDDKASEAASVPPCRPARGDDQDEARTRTHAQREARPKRRAHGCARNPQDAEATCGTAAHLCGAAGTAGPADITTDYAVSAATRPSAAFSGTLCNRALCRQGRGWPPAGVPAPSQMAWGGLRGREGVTVGAERAHLRSARAQRVQAFARHGCHAAPIGRGLQRRRPWMAGGAGAALAAGAVEPLNAAERNPHCKRRDSGGMRQSSGSTVEARHAPGAVTRTGMMRSGTLLAPLQRLQRSGPSMAHPP
jgi:hypothetical protein